MVHVVGARLRGIAANDGNLKTVGTAQPMNDKMVEG